MVNVVCVMLFLEALIQFCGNTIERLNPNEEFAMPFTLKEVVPWGRNYLEYCQMFLLTEHDIRGKRILGCADGPASFNAELRQQGGRIFSLDPLYGNSASAIASRFQETCDTVLEQTKKNSHMFTWGRMKDINHLKSIRMATMKSFIEDFSQHHEYYVAGQLPDLPFADKSFSLALCSHFLFLYSQQYSTNFHLQAVKELCRVSHEVRIFPLIDLEGKISAHLEKVIHQLVGHYHFNMVGVDYDFLKNGTTMLTITPIE